MTLTAKITVFREGRVWHTQKKTLSALLDNRIQKKLSPTT